MNGVNVMVDVDLLCSSGFFNLRLVDLQGLFGCRFLARKWRLL